MVEETYFIPETKEECSGVRCQENCYWLKFEGQCACDSDIIHYKDE